MPLASLLPLILGALTPRPASAGVELAPPAVEGTASLPMSAGTPFQIELDNALDLFPPGAEPPSLIAPLEKLRLDFQAEKEPLKKAAMAEVLEAIAQGSPEPAGRLQEAGLHQPTAERLSSVAQRLRQARFLEPGLSQALQNLGDEAVRYRREASGLGPERTMAQEKAAVIADPLEGLGSIPAVQESKGFRKEKAKMPKALEEYSEGSEAEKALLQAPQRLSQAETAVLFGEFMRQALRPESRVVLEPLDYPDNSKKMTYGAEMISRLYTKHGWGEKPHEIAVFHALVRTFAAKRGFIWGAKQWTESMADYDKYANSMLRAYEVPLQAIAEAASKKPSLIPRVSDALVPYLAEGVRNLRMMLESHAGLQAKTQEHHSVKALSTSVRETYLPLILDALDKAGKADPNAFTPEIKAGLEIQLERIARDPNTPTRLELQAKTLLERLQNLPAGSTALVPIGAIQLSSLPPRRDSKARGIVGSALAGAAAGTAAAAAGAGLPIALGLFAVAAPALYLLLRLRRRAEAPGLEEFFDADAAAVEKHLLATGLDSEERKAIAEEIESLVDPLARLDPKDPK